MFSSFTAAIGEIEITWTPEEPFLSGNPYAVEVLRKELDANALISITSSGPRTISIETDAAAVFTAINNLYGITNVTYTNAPDISLLWTEESVEGELVQEVNY